MEHLLNRRKHIWRGELVLLAAVYISSMGVSFMIYSGAGISAISSVPYAFSAVLPQLSLGTWTYLFQGFLVISLMFLRRKFVPQYLFSFVVGFGFGILLDFHGFWIYALPDAPACSFFYFFVGYALICVGIALSNRCGLPIVPTDLFPRELSEITGVSYARIKVFFDLSCLALTAGMTGIFLGSFEGLGIGTIAAALTVGKTVSVIGSLIDRKVRVVSFMTERAVRYPGSLPISCATSAPS